jgi:outer membrane protein, heavy metal efflux system
MKHWFFLSVALVAAVCNAQPALRPAPTELPQNEAAAQLIDTEPSVAQARFALEAARQKAQGLIAGPHEWAARGTVQRRRDRPAGSDATEWLVGVERAVRIGGKAGIDRDLGESHVRLAQARYGEARHEAARELLDMWLDWLAADRMKRLWQEQAQFAQDNLAVATKRRSAGDASLLEQNAARVDEAEVRRQLSGASNDETKARARLKARFPGLELQPPSLSEPQGLDGEPAQWRERILEESDELRTAREEFRIAELQAARARADRVADPTVGVFTSSERAGAERIVGLSFSMPFGGTARQAQEFESQQHAQAARSAVERKQLEIEAEIAQDLADMAGSLERWRISLQGLEASRDSTRLTQRAYGLGEADLQTLLLARRQGVEAALGSEQARLDALRARNRLYIDAHLIWGLQDD